MKILLQNVHSKLYYCPRDIWSANPVAAFNFRQSIQALDFVRKQNLRDVQLVIKFEDAQWDEIVPLPIMVATLSARRAA
jgi:hypothetical protein